MKSFDKFINEAKRDLPGGNPGGFTASDIKKFKNVVNTGERPKNLSTDQDRSQRTIRKRSSAGTSWEGDPKAIEYAKDLEQANKSPSLRGTADTTRTQTKNPTVRQAASNILGGGRKPTGDDVLVGTGAKSGTGQEYRDKRPSETKSTAVSQSDVSKQQSAFRRKYEVNQGRAKPLTGAELDKSVRRAFPTGKGGLKADELNPYVRRQVRIDRANRLGVPDPFVSKNPAPARPFKSIIKSQPSAPVKPNIPDPFATGSAPAKIKRSTPGAPPRTALKQAVANIRGAEARRLAVKSTPLPPTKPTTTKQKATADKVFQALKRGKSDQYRGYALSGVGPTGEILDKSTRKYYKNLARTPFGVEKYKPKIDPAGADRLLNRIDGAKNTSLRALKDAEKHGLPPTKYRPFTKKPMGPAQKTFRAFTGQGAAGTRLTKSVSRTTKGLGVLGAGLTGIDAYQRARQAGSSQKRSAAYGVVKALGGALGAAAGTTLGATVGGLGAGVGGVMGYEVGSRAADKAFQVVAGANRKEKQVMATRNRKEQGIGTLAGSSEIKHRIGNRAIIKDRRTGKEVIGHLAKSKFGDTFKAPNLASSLQHTSSNPIERIGRSIPFLKGYYASKDEKKRQSDVAAFKQAAGAK